MKPNPGHCPEDAKGHRVRVVLEKDRQTMHEPNYDDRWNPMSKPGWAADSSRWTRTGAGHDIAFYEVI